MQQREPDRPLNPAEEERRADAERREARNLRPEATPEQDGAGAPGDLPLGKADTPNVAGSGEQQPEIAEGPVPGVQPDEAGHATWQPPVAEDPPPRGAAPASGDYEAVRRQKERGGP
ncbi:hypothetical protein [Streptomyces zingiberis]|uniref:Uncharacterized protein n=1 Tax=Streptomyces zingiberis TaxID=2053010 RepID=A0ABX1BTB9_9ACTN|nr:hypothetical protein [Streptomyces zingiberis]NJQ00338.1 hypothetical protein [Streptomyces zingiberis]